MRIRGHFVPLFRNPHVATIAGNYWRRQIEATSFPPIRQLYKIDEQTTIAVYEHRPVGPPRGQLIFLHGLEGSADAGYIQSFAQLALSSGFVVHRCNLRTCGRTEDLCTTMYHSGLTDDTKVILQRLRDQSALPIFLIGFSLGGNVSLKLAGELGENDLLAGVCSISAPIDLAACVRKLGAKSNLLYSRRFLQRLRERIIAKSALHPDLYSKDGLDSVSSVWEFDDRYTAPLFGFGSAANYYKTQSAIRYLGQIRTPTLLIAADDDPLVPFEAYADGVFDSNPYLHLVTTKYGGHLGFLSRRAPRFWLDHTCIDWIEQQIGRPAALGKAEEEPSVQTAR